MTDFKTKGIYSALANLISDWSSLNQDAKDAFVYEALQGFVAQGFYELPDDITTTGNKYFLELYEVGLLKFGAK
jgi:hypothetical protein